ncbi:MAG: hypothetical protein RLZZ290_493 [Pseudomonadota bacterium]|jgi:SulP family sulfate permease
MPAWFAPWRQERSWQTSLAGDLPAAVLVTLMLIPQSLAYAVLAGVPAHIGLAASIFPLIAYAAFGRSPALAVGPVAIASAMTMSALMPLAQPESPTWVAMAALLACMSGLMLFLMGALRLGFIASLLSHPVMSGFISGAAILIVLGQLGSLSGIRVHGDNAVELLDQLWHQSHLTHIPTLELGLLVLFGLVLIRRYAGCMFRSLGANGLLLDVLTKTAPLSLLALAAWIAPWLDPGQSIRVVGRIPTGFSQLGLSTDQWVEWPGHIVNLLPSALLIGLIGFIESVSMARAIAQRRTTKVDPNAELRGLGAANIASGLSGAFPVTGGLSRSVVNLEGGAQTPMAGVYSAVLMLLVLLGVGEALSALPLTALAALVIVAVTTLVDLRALPELMRYDRVDALSWMLTLLGVLMLGVESGILAGIAVSVLGLLWRQSRPHIAILGRIPGTEHFRNLSRHAVETRPGLLMVRIDANLFFGNWDRLHDAVMELVNSVQTRPQHIVLCMASVNDIDATALDGLRRMRTQLSARGIHLAFSELKGPVQDKLMRVDATHEWKIFLSNQEAFEKAGLA